VTPAIPRPDADSAPFWAAAADGRLELPRCRACGTLHAYPRRRCPSCGSDDISWERLSGRATVHAVTVIHRPPEPALADAVPYALALVDLEEGPRLMTRIVDCPPESVWIGQAVVVRFEPVGDGQALPLFAPRADG
jgi:uncharacterized OB-fold protein